MVDLFGVIVRFLMHLLLDCEENTMKYLTISARVVMDTEQALLRSVWPHEAHSAQLSTSTSFKGI